MDSLGVAVRLTDYGIRMRKRTIFAYAVALTLLLSVAIAPSVHANANPHDIASTKQSHALIELETARARGYDGRGQTIVVIDQGVQVDHPYLKEALVDGYCSSDFICPGETSKSGIAMGAVRTEPGRTNLDSHGSMVAGIAAGRGSGDIPSGIAPNASLISINNTGGNDPGIEKALRWVLSIKDKYNIAAVSASFAVSGGGARGGESLCRVKPVIDGLIKQLHDAGIAFVAAAGNAGAFSNVGYPACSPYAIGVGAVDSEGAITSYSDIGKTIAVLAPADVVGASPTNSYFIGAGTSSAAPVVAGAIALLKQAMPNATVPEIRAALATSKTYLADVIWKNLPVLHLPSALNAITTGAFTRKSVTHTEIGDLTDARLAAESALLETRGKLAKLEEELSALTSQVKRLEASERAAASKLKKICAARPKPKGC